MLCHCKKPQCKSCPGTTETGEIIKRGHKGGAPGVSAPKQLYECRACGHKFTVGDKREQNRGRPSKFQCQYPQCPKKGYLWPDNTKGAYLCNEHYRNRASASATIMIEQLLKDGVITKSPIKTFKGQKSFFCRVCGDYVPVAYHCKGESENDGTRIYWDFVEDAKGHTIVENSH